MRLVNSQNTDPGDARLTDRFGRTVTYVRVSVTDRCNYRCVYCMPPEGIDLLPKSEFLTYDEIATVLRVGARLGIRKVRFTGGEPLVRKDIELLIAATRDIPGIETLALTTNGFNLPETIGKLRDAGLTNLNVSVDSLDPDRYAALTRRGGLKPVMEGVRMAVALGVRVKTNAVVMEDMTEEEAFDFVRLTERMPIDHRFIEFMPLCGTGWQRDRFVSLNRVEKAIRGRFAHTDEGDDGVSRMIRVEGHAGRVGFISALSRDFCDRCNRLRLTAVGKIRGCLFSDGEVDLRTALRTASDPEAAVRRLLLEAAENKPEGHRFDPEANASARPDSPLIRMLGG